MKNIHLLILFFCVNFLANAQDVTLQMTNIKVIMAKTDTVKTVNKNLSLKNNGGFQEVELFNENNLKIKASYKINTHFAVRRSNLKKSAVNVKIVYTFFYQGKKNKIKVQRIFYLDDEKSFEEEQTAIFRNGINNKLFHLKYNCIVN
jgi:hypothetical protein